MKLRIPATLTIVESYLILLYVVDAIDSNPEQIKHRVKRKIVFSKSSKLFFRLNGKDNVLPNNTIFAHGYTIRINYDLPESLPKRHKFFKRNVAQELFEFSKRNDKPEISCIFKYFCQIMEQIRESGECGILCEISQLITSDNGTEAAFFKNFIENCNYHNDVCPYWFEHSSFSYG